MSQRNERNVMFGYVDEKKLPSTMEMVNQDITPTVEDIANAVPKFKRDDSFTTFTAEYAVQEGNVIVHFFLTEDMKLGKELSSVTQYWSNHFPSCLDAVARSYFSAESPRLQAKYTAEFESWWFRARGYGHIIDIDGFINGFFENLDRALERKG